MMAEEVGSWEGIEGGEGPSRDERCHLRCMRRSCWWVGRCIEHT